MVWMTLVSKLALHEVANDWFERLILNVKKKLQWNKAATSKTNKPQQAFSVSALSFFLNAVYLCKGLFLHRFVKFNPSFNVW